VATETWKWVAVNGASSMRGVMVDRADRAWFATNSMCGVAVVDVASQAVIAPLVDLAGCVMPVGVSIDGEGYVWVVDQGANLAFKVNPDTYAVELTATGLNAPYTYSDMTGAGLDLVTNPPQG